MENLELSLAYLWNPKPTLYEIPYLTPHLHNLTFFTRLLLLKDYAFRTMTLKNETAMGCQGLMYGK
jgi:hypothetical protein